MPSIEENLAAATKAMAASTQALDDFYQDQRDPLNAKIAQMEAARNNLPGEMMRDIYVDAVNGDDLNMGSNRGVRISTPTGRPQSKINLNYNPSISPNFDYEVSGIVPGHLGGSVAFANVEVVVPPRDPAIVSHLEFGIFGVGISGSMMVISFSGCTITMPADPATSLIRRSTRSLSLSVSSTVFDAARMPGRWIHGVGAGTDPNDHPDILTNLGSL